MWVLGITLKIWRVCSRCAVCADVHEAVGGGCVFIRVPLFSSWHLCKIRKIQILKVNTFIDVCVYTAGSNVKIKVCLQREEKTQCSFLEWWVGEQYARHPYKRILNPSFLKVKTLFSPFSMSWSDGFCIPPEFRSNSHPLGIPRVAFPRSAAASLLWFSTFLANRLCQKRQSEGTEGG